MSKILNTLSEYIERNDYLAFSIIYIISGLSVIIFNQGLFSRLVQRVLSQRCGGLFLSGALFFFF